LEYGFWNKISINKCVVQKKVMSERAINKLQHRVLKLLQDVKNPKKRSMVWISEQLNLSKIKITNSSGHSGNQFDIFLISLKKLLMTDEIKMSKSNTRPGHLSTGHLATGANPFFEYNQFPKKETNMFKNIENTFDSTQCPICICDFTADCIVKVLPCKHIVCLDCISKWVYACPNRCFDERSRYLEEWQDWMNYL
jgi:hypothetical protein